ncbi:MAG: sodium-dependent transporter [Deltaproteobacteria bacterium]|nr:sodium-dependent transporter [Deltaproteobacteria bacterium]
MPEQRSQWKSRIGFLMAVIGSAIGLGNIWRFPYLAYRNGGGAFLIPYFIALFSVGIPLMMLEQGIGHALRGSAPLAFARVRRRFEFGGWWMVSFVTFGILLYYCVVLGWCTNYFVYSFGLDWGADTQAFFEKSFLAVSSGPFDIGGIRPTVLFGVAAIWFINWFIIYRGVSKGIELANLIMMPLLVIIMIALVVWGAMLPGAVEGIKAYLTPNLEVLKNPSVWADAFAQIFFTLSLGFGIMIAYSSYLPSTSPIKKNAFISCLANCGFEIFAGFAVFSALGFMAVKSGVPVTEVAKGGPGLAFVMYPQIINQLPYGKNLFGILFFMALIFAGITSSISILEAFISGIIDKFGWSRKAVASVVCLLGFSASLIFATRAGLYWVDIVDYFLNHYGLLVAGLLETILIAWIFKAERLRTHINSVGSSLGRWWVYVVSIWIPLILGVLLAADIYKNVREPYSGYSWNALIFIGIGSIVVNLFIAAVLTRIKWKRVVDDK